MGSVQAALNTPWIMEIDTAIKPLYGKQESPQVSYNPHKPGRPSHALHTYWVANLRLVLDVVVSPGKEHSEAKAPLGLMNILRQLASRIQGNGCPRPPLKLSSCKPGGLTNTMCAGGRQCRPQTQRKVCGYCGTSSTRRFLARPSSPLLLATGARSATPKADRRLAATP